LSGPGGHIAATQKLIEWETTKTSDDKTTLYFYKTDNTSLETGKILNQSIGAIWISNGTLYQLESSGDVKQLGDLYKKIALTFSKK